MSLFDDIQSSVLEDGNSLAPVLLKLRLLASRLECDPLAQWVRDELEGYKSSAVPPYRVVDVAYRGDFSGPFESGYRNIAIPTALINQIAGDHWTRHEFTGSITEVGQLARSALSDGELQLQCSNLMLHLHGKILPDLSCIGVVGVVSRTQMASILDVVRSRILDLTIAMEKAEPNIRKASVTLEGNQSTRTNMDQVVQQVVHTENVTNTFLFERDLEKIVADRIAASGGTDRQKAGLSALVKGTGVQEIVKQVVQKAPDLVKFLGSLPS